MSKQWMRTIAMGLAFCLPGVSDAKQHPARSLATPAGRLEQAGVSLEVDVLDAQRAEDIFNTDLVGQGIQPLVISLHNVGTQTYAFRKSNVTPTPLPATHVARHSYTNPLVMVVRGIWWLLSCIPALIFHSLFKSAYRPAFPGEIREDYAQEEIGEATLGPNGSLEGFLFLPLLPPGSHLTLKLLNVSTQEPLVFDVPLAH